MILRRILLMVLLAGLGTCAVAGTFSIFARSETLAAIFGAAITLAVAMGMLLPLTLLVDRPHWRAGGIGAMVLVTLLACFIVGLILSDIFRVFGSVRLDDTCAMMLGFTLLMGIPAVGGLFLVRFAWGKVAAWSCAITSGFAWLIAAVGTFDLNMNRYASYESSSMGERILALAMAVFVTGFVSALLLVNVGRGDRRYFRFPAIGLGVIAMLLFLTAVMSEFRDSGDALARLITALSVPVIFCAHLNIVLMLPARGVFAWVKAGTMACSAGCGGMVWIAMLSQGMDSEVIAGAAAAAGIPALCGTLALVASALLGRARSERVIDYSSTLTDIKITCPRCAKAQTVLLGDSACAGCGLVLSIKATEPRCKECGYMLYGITSPRCPECGTEVAGVGGVTAPVVAG